MVIDLGRWIDRLAEALPAFGLGPPGAYRRWRDEDASGAGVPDPYGCADAANLLYTLDRFPRDAGERAAWVEMLRSLQDPESGFFREETHHEIHTTAHCVAALELFDAAPRHPLSALERLEEPGALEAFLDGLDWAGDPWLASHRGAGVYAARVVAREASPAFEARYFDWLAEQVDPATGLWRVGCVRPPYAWGDNRFPHLAGTFHYLFNLEHGRRPHPHPAALVDTCLDLWWARDWPLGETVSFAEVDWVYCTSRALAQSHHRVREVERALVDFAQGYAIFLEALDLATDPRAGDLHGLFGSACAWAELQRAMPGLVRTPRPLRLVLDRRPFI